MELYIYNESRELTGIIESFEYFRWTRRYSQCGSFELKAIASPENTALLQIGNFLWKSDDEEAGLIEHLEMSQTDKETITAVGRFATSFLSRRIIWETEMLSGDLSICVEQLLNNHLIAPSDSTRMIPGFTFDSVSLDIPVNTQISYKNLMDSVTELCDASDAGIKTVFSPAPGNLTVTVYFGAASSAVFSREYENLNEQVYTTSVIDYANTALVGGEGEGPERIFVTITGDTGENRREVFVDAKDLRQADFGDGYTDALIYRGQSKLNELVMRQTFDSEINPHGNLTYKTDFDLGNTVQVISKKWGVSLLARITEIEESYDASGQTLNIVFGKSVLSLFQKLKGGI